MTLLASLVAFSEFGDRVTIRTSDRMALSVSGPQGALVPNDHSNLAVRAAVLVADGRGAEICLDKQIPVAAGLGGGSSDAATVTRLLEKLWGLPPTDADSLAALGADLPACMTGHPVLVEGIGERVTKVDTVPDCELMLVNPGVPLPTGRVFQAYAGQGAPALDMPPATGNIPDFVAWLAGQRNDLELAAMRLVPAIGRVLEEIAATESCLLARMSGSGATCFGVFPQPDAAQEAARRIAAGNPGWWVMPTRLRAAGPAQLFL